MVELLLAMGVPTAGFGLFALLAFWLGAESRPWFDERPVLDDRPNWFPIARRSQRDDDEDDDEPGRGMPVPAERARRQRAPVAASRAATSPSGV
ncbi:MAG: hypothetical protein ACXVFL_02190 [Solirubrobacteraceae bacterium]